MMLIEPHGWRRISSRSTALEAFLLSVRLQALHRANGSRRCAFEVDRLLR
jgi:hypothetical protein